MSVATTAPKRIQLRRTKGWRKPEGCVVVARPTRFGNPFPVDGDWTMWAAIGLGYTGNPSGRRAAAVALYRAWMTGQPVRIGPKAGATDGGVLEFADGTQRAMGDHVLDMALLASTMYKPPTLPAERPDVAELRGHDLGCWCPLLDAWGEPVPCHATVLLELANDPKGSA